MNPHLWNRACLALIQSFASAEFSSQVNTLLAMVATIFLPLTFLCGVYGMNFNTHEGSNAIPLLSLGNGFGGYIAYWGMCLVFIVLLLLMFMKRGWFALVGFSSTEAVRVVGYSLLVSAFLILGESCLWIFNMDHVQDPPRPSRL
jgi:hypothetical protein